MTITVFGLGFVGLTTSLGFAEYGHTVYGVEMNPERLSTIQNGQLPFLDTGENVFYCLKINIESGTMNSGALYDFLYGNAPEFFFQIQVPECTLYFGSGTAARGGIFGHDDFLLKYQNIERSYSRSACDTLNEMGLFM